MRLKILHERRKKVDDGFDYSSISKDMWGDELRKALKKFKASFDSENDEAIKSRDIEIPQKTWDHTKCKFKCELRAASGDWQAPSYYFRCQMTDGYAAIDNKHTSKCFVVIPNGKQGNVQMQLNAHGIWCPPDAEREKEDNGKPSEKQCWDFLNGYLTELVRREEQDVGEY